MTAHGFYTLLEAARLPPVEGWNPPFCGSSRMRIARDGSWFHDGARIDRPELARLFAGLLRREGDDYFLVTPAEKLSIEVENVPFVAVTLTDDDTQLTFTTNMGDRVVLGAGHGLRMQDGIPYLQVRRGLEARVARPVWHQLAAMAVPQDDALGVWSDGAFFALGAACVSLLADLRACLPQVPQDIARRDDIDMDLAPQAAPAPPARAAVLLPIILRDAPTLLFTRRTATLARHSGQVSFPGGRSEPHDISPLETALRETFEETGIATGLVTVADYLARYLTGTGFDIQPVVGVVAPGFALAPDPREVAEIFEVPLDFLRNPANRRRESRMIAGHERRYYAFTYKEHEIWGVTAAIVVSLVEHLDSKPAISPP